MATMRGTGASGWVMGMAAATVEDCQDRLRRKWSHVNQEGAELALLRLSGATLTEEQHGRLCSLGTTLGLLVQKSGAAQQKLVEVADGLNILGEAPDCTCDRCVGTRRSMLGSLMDYWTSTGSPSQLPWTSLARSGSL